MSIEYELQDGTVAILEEGAVVGTGFFIGADGSILTCFHTVGSRQSRQHAATVEVRFRQQQLQADVRFVPERPEIYDFAVLQLQAQELPAGAIVMPLDVTQRVGDSMRFRTFGFRHDEGRYANGQIMGFPERSGLRQIQLESQGEDTQQLRAGMSGAAIIAFLGGRPRLIGMVIARDLTGPAARPQEIIPFGLPLLEVARFWPPLRQRLNERLIWNALERHFTQSPLAREELSDLRDRLSLVAPFFSSPFPPDDNWIELLQREELAGRSLLAPLLNLLKARHLARYDRLRQGLRQAQDEQVLLPEISFANRQEELREFDKPYPPTFLFYKAPAGFGKTELLQEIETRLVRQHWVSLSFSLACSPARTAFGLARQIVAPFTPPRRQPTSLDECVELVLQHLDRLSLDSTTTIRGLVLLLDDVHDEALASEAEIRAFVDGWLLPLSVQLRRRQAPPNRFLCRLATRCFFSSWEQALNAHSSASRSNRVHLLPLSHIYVKQTLEQLELKGRDEWAAQLLYLTGGHPGCMAQLITANLAEPGFRALDTFLAREPQHRAAVLERADEAYTALPAALRDDLVTLSVFRQLNPAVLENILAQGLITSPTRYDALDYHRELVTLGIYRKAADTLSGSLVRHLLLRRLAWNQRQRHQTLCREAATVYERLLAEGRLQPALRAQFLLNNLLLVLEERALCRQDAPGERAALREQFLASGGLLDEVLGRFAAADLTPDDRARLFEALAELMPEHAEQIEEGSDGRADDEYDREFCFNVNFFLRDGAYSYKPYTEVRASILGRRGAPA